MKHLTRVIVTQMDNLNDYCFLSPDFERFIFAKYVKKGDLRLFSIFRAFLPQLPSTSYLMGGVPRISENQSLSLFFVFSLVLPNVH